MRILPDGQRVFTDLRGVEFVDESSTLPIRCGCEAWKQCPRHAEGGNFNAIPTKKTGHNPHPGLESVDTVMHNHRRALGYALSGWADWRENAQDYERRLA